MMHKRLNQLQRGCRHTDNFDYHSGYQQALIDVEESLDDAYLAGIFDGEGCVYSRPDGRIYLGVTNKDRETCERFKERFGGSIAAHHPPGCWRWTGTGKAAHKMAVALLPFLAIKGDALRQAKAINFGNKTDWARQQIHPVPRTYSTPKLNM